METSTPININYNNDVISLENEDENYDDYQISLIIEELYNNNEDNSEDNNEDNNEDNKNNENNEDNNYDNNIKKLKQGENKKSNTIETQGENQEQNINKNSTTMSASSASASSFAHPALPNNEDQKSTGSSSPTISDAISEKSTKENKKRNIKKKEIKASQNETCQICEEKYNKSNRLHVTCDYCEYEACRECQQTYILSVEIPQCMNCHKEWNRNAMVKKFTRVFIDTELKDKRKQLLFDQERALMPGTQPIVERMKYVSKIRKHIRHIEKKIEILNTLKNNYYHECTNIDLYNLEIKLPLEVLEEDFKMLDVITANYSEKISKVFEERRKENQTRGGGGAGNATDTNNGNGEKNNHNHTFIRACPAEGCRGFLSTQWKCGICDKWTCPNCHEVKGNTREATHECKPENVESAKLLAKETKPCPKCASNIFKIDGCDQMWCTQCHTAFSWRTGKIETTVHNPHYFEYMRRINSGHVDRNPLDIQCGREIDHYFIQRLTNNVLYWTSDSVALYNDYIMKRNRIDRIISWVDLREQKNNYKINFTNPETCEMNQKNYIREQLFCLGEKCRNLVHIRAVELPRYVQNREHGNEDLRIQYLNDQIDENSFKNTIVLRDKNTDKNREMANILNMFLTCVTDILFRFDNHVRKLTTDDKAERERITKEYAKLETVKTRANAGNAGNAANTTDLKVKIYPDHDYKMLEFENYINEINTLVDYVNENLKEISITYKCKEKIILKADFTYI